MTGVLHPIGPEPERTYWLRRVVLLAVVVLLVGGLIAFGSTLGRGPARAAGSPSEASASAIPTEAPTSSPTATPSVTSTSTPSQTPSEKASEKASDKKSSEPSSSAKGSPSATPTSTPSSAAPALCAPSQLSTKVSGDRSLKVDQDTTFTVALTNRAAATCTLAVAPSTFELKVYSGTDRIWSTKDCASAIKPTAAILKPGQAMTLRQTWNGRRSGTKCKNAAGMPRPGVYWATAQYAGAKPTQLRMIVS